MNFAGCEELRAYVRDAKHPSFKAFVDVNSLNIARWSANINMEASDLFSMWRRRYALFLKEYQKTDYILSSKKYDENKWQLIAKMAKTLFEASFVARIEMLEAMIAAAPSSSSILKELLSRQKDEYKQQQEQEEKDVQQQEEKELKRQAQQQQSAEDLQFEDLDKEGRIYLLGHKKA